MPQNNDSDSPVTPERAEAIEYYTLAVLVAGSWIYGVIYAVSTWLGG